MEHTEVPKPEQNATIIVLHDRVGDPEMWDGLDDKQVYTVSGRMLRCPVCLSPSSSAQPVDMDKFRVEKKPDGEVRAAWCCSPTCSTIWEEEVREGLR